jgi:retron-type reverse transcriptase
LLSLIEKILRNGGANGKGLPIGNLTSQFFANVYLNTFDHFIKENLRVKYYIRYMDDFVLFSNDKEQLKIWRTEINNYLHKQLQLSLKKESVYVNSRLNGLSFLGTRVFPRTIRIRQENLKRYVRRMKKKA